MLFPSDVPIHRGSVGAMAVASGGRPAWPDGAWYVYRGTGEDQFPETAPLPAKRKPTKAQRERKHQKAMAALHRRHEKRVAQEARQRKWEADRLADRLAWLEHRLERGPAPRRPEPEPVPVVREPKPAPGWRPLAGADLLDLLGEDE